MGLQQPRRGPAALHDLQGPVSLARNSPARRSGNRSPFFCATNEIPPARPRLHLHHVVSRRARAGADHSNSAEADRKFFGQQRPGGGDHRGNSRRPVCAHAVHLRADPGQPVRSLRTPPDHPHLAVRLGVRLSAARVCAQPAVVFLGPDHQWHQRRERHRRHRLHRGHQPAGKARGQFRHHRRGLWPGLHRRAGARRLAGRS